MDDFIFDLQRFSNKIFPTVLTEYGEIPLTIGGLSIIIASESENAINVSLNSADSSNSLSATDAALSLAASDVFNLTESDTKKRHYSMQSQVGSNGGIVVTVDSSAKSTVGSIDEKDLFVVHDEESNSATYSMTKTGLLVDYNSISSGYDGFVKNDSLSSVVLNNTSLDSSTANFYKVIEVDDKKLVIDDKDDFSTVGYTGKVVYAMNTSSGTPSIYAKLISTNSVPYRVSSVTGSENNTLSTIKINSNDVLSKGISFSPNFAGANDKTPTLITGNTTFHVDSVNDNPFFTVSGGKDSPIALKGTNEVSLLDGSIVTAINAQSIKTSSYTVSGYADSKNNNDGVIIYYGGSGTDATIGDVDVGESFVIANGTSNATYSMTNFGLIRDGSKLPLSISGSNGSSYQRITDEALSVSMITAASVMSSYTDTFLDATKPITLSGGSSTPSLIAYWDSINSNGTGALATLTTVSDNTYSLSSGNTTSALNLEKWGGISLSSGKNLILDRTSPFINSDSPLTVMAEKATFGFASVNVDNVTISGSIDIIPNDINAVKLINGTLKVEEAQTVTLSGGNDIEFVSYDNNHQTLISDSGSGGATIMNGTNNYSDFKVGRGTIRPSIPNNSITVITDSIGNARITNFSKANTNLILHNKDDDNTTTWQPLIAGNGVILVYGKESGTSVTGLNDGDIFRSTVSSSNSVKTYQVVTNTDDNSLVLLSYEGTVVSNDIQIFESNVDSETAYDLATTKFNNNMSANNGVISISSENNFESNETRSIIDISTNNKTVSAVSGNYGTLAKSLGSYYVNLNDKKTLSGVAITDNLPVHFKSGNFINTSISLAANNVTKYAFKNLDNPTSEFQVGLRDDNETFSISGASSISLISGTILADSLSPEIRLSDGNDSYIVSSESIGSGSVNIGISVSGSGNNQTSTAIIEDIDIGESFNVNGKTYTRQNSPLNIMADGYSYVVDTVSGAWSKSDSPVAVKISDLTNNNNRRKIIAAESVSSIDYGDGKWVLSLSSKNTENAIIADTTTTSLVKAAYADLSITSDRNYYLDTIDNAKTDSWNADIISISGGTASINSAAVAASVGKQSRLIVAASSKTAFKVNGTPTLSGGFFIVNGKDSSPQSIVGATDLNLISGSLETANQTIRFGEDTNPVTLKTNASTNVGYKDSVATVATASLTGFSLGGSSTSSNKTNGSYSVVSGDGINFNVDGSSGNVTVTGFDTDDVLYFRRNYYSLKSAGLVKKDENNKEYLWDNGGVHTLPNSSVAISSLTSGTWRNILALTNNTATVTTSGFKNSAILIDDNYTGTYGKLSGSNGSYTLTKENTDTLPLSVVAVTGDNATLTLDKKFTDITIQSSTNNSVAPVSFSTSNDTYQFIQTNNIAGFSGVKEASLFSGSLSADSALTVTVSGDNNTSAVVNAVGDANITLTGGTNAAVVLGTGKSVVIDSTNYTLGSLGLTKSGKFLPSVDADGDGQNTLKISDINNSDSWYNLITVTAEGGTLSIDSSTSDKTFVVNSDTAPSEQYASISSTTGGFVLSTLGTATDDWSNKNTIFIGNQKTVTISNNFLENSLKTNKADFIVASNSNGNDFVVTDSKSGASISDNTEVSLVSGTIATGNTNQTISTPDGYKIKYANASGNDIKIIYDSNDASISALDSLDVFTVGETTYSVTSDNKKLITADSLWTSTINNTIKVADLKSVSNWLKYVTISGGAITVNSDAINNNLSGGESAYIIDQNDNSMIYGKLYKDTNNGYLLSRDDSTRDSSITSVTINETSAPISLTSYFVKNTVSINAGSNTALRVGGASDTFTVTYNTDDYAQVGNATIVSLDTGTVKTYANGQTIKAADSSSSIQNIYAVSLGGDSAAMWVSNNNASISVGGLEAGDKFAVGSATYTYTDVGVIYLNGNNKKISDNASLENKVFSVGTAFSRDILTLNDDKVLDLSKQTVAAVVLDNDTLPTTKIADLTYDSTNSYFSVESTVDSIGSIYLGTKSSVSIDTDFNTAITTSLNSSQQNVLQTIGVNGDTYLASKFPLTIQAGGANAIKNNSSLISGAVSLGSSSFNTVRTSANTVSVGSGDLSLKADNSDPVTITGLNEDDIFTADGTSYSVKSSTSLLKNNQIWNKDFSSGVLLSNSGGSGLTNAENWNYYISVDKNSVLVVPPKDDIDKWFILSNDLASIYGTISSVNGGYSFAANGNWNTANSIISITSAAESFIFPENNFRNAKIKTRFSGAEFSVTDNKTFTVTDNKADREVLGNVKFASIAGAEKISQTGGTIALTDSLQTIELTTNSTTHHSVSFIQGTDGIWVKVGGTSASIGALTITKGVEDKFKVDGYTYQMLSSKSIRRIDDKKYWLGDTIANDGSVDIDSLTSDSNWLDSSTISNDVLKLSPGILDDFTPPSAFIVDEDDPTKIYGQLTSDSIGDKFTLDGTTATEGLSSIELSNYMQVNLLDDDYLNVSITAGNTTFTALKEATAGGFSISYTAESLGTDAPSVSLISGAWDLSDTNQTLKAGEQVIQVGESSTVTASIISGGVDITGLDTADEIVSINSGDNKALSFKLNSTTDKGISISLNSEKAATIKDISDGDNFKINNDTFIKKSAGFIKTNDANTDNYLWINALNVTGGVSAESLTGNNDNNWAKAETIGGGSIVIDSKISNTAIFIDSVDSLTSVYGVITQNSTNNYTLNNEKSAASAKTKPSLITVDKVGASLTSYYKDVPIYAAGASFIVNALSSTDSLFYIDATGSNATLGNVANVSLGSGTLADLTKATTVKGSNHTIAALDNSTINIGLSDTLFTLSKLDDGEGFTFDGNKYVYKDVGIVKDNEKLFVKNSLAHSITSDSIMGADYLSMFANGGTTTLTLQSKASGVFVDNAGDSVSEVYAFQTYDDINKVYSITPNLLNIDNYVINAASLASGAGISAAFKGQVITPTTGTFTINNKTYSAVTELAVDTTTDSSTLNKGTATLAASASIAMTNGDSISVTSGDGIQVTATPNSYTLGELDKGDAFVIGGYSYSMLSDNYLFRTKDGTPQLCTTSVTGGALSSSVILDSNNWDNYVLLERDYTLNLGASSIDDGTVISYDLSKIYAEVTVNGKKFTLDKIAGANIAEISRVSLGSDSSTLTADFATTVRTTSGTGTYNVNGNPYTAKNSELVIQTSTDNSSIMSGVIALNNSPEITTGNNHTVGGTANEFDVVKMNFTPTTGDNFTVDGTTYKMNTVGLTKNDSYIWTRSNVENFVLPAADSLWSAMMTLNKDGTLNLKNGVSASSVVILDNAVTKRMALLNYATSDNAYSLTSEGGNSIATILLGDSTDSILSFTANFDSSITAGNGLYKINGNNYRGNGFTVETADNDSALYAGTVSLSAGTVYNSISDSLNSYEVTGGDGLTATATNASITALGNLNSGDTFTLNSKYYKVLGNQTLVQTDSDGGTPSKIYKDLIAGGALNTADIIDNNFVDFVEMGTDGVLDLTSALGTDGWSAVILADDDRGDPTIRVAKVSYTDEGGYKLETTSDGDPSTLTAVKLGAAVKTFSTTIDTTVNISAVGTYNINGQSFTAQNDLKIAASNGDEATLINGAVTLGEDVEVTTRRTNSGTQTDETIKTTSGSITVTVDETAGTVTLSGLNPGEKFTFGNNEYTMTPIGLQNGTKLNTTVATTATVPTTDLDLTGENWLTLLQATDGALILNSNTASNVIVVDMTSSTQAVRYGTLTKSGDIYTLTQDDSDAKLTSIALNGVRATLGAKASDVDITTNGSTTFSVTATDNFTINAASGGNPSVSDVSNVSGIYLSAGTITAPINIPVTANGYAVKATNGDMNISVVDGATQISGLDRDDTFTVDDTTEYKMVDIGLLDVTNQQLRTQVEDTFTIGEEFTRIIAVDGTNLDISNETKDAHVYDSISEPITQLGIFTISKGVKTLEAVDNGATVMQSVDIAAKDKLIVTFETRVNSPVGTVTVNDKTYAGTTALAIDSDGTTSTLYDGTITLDITNPSATDSSGNSLAREVGTFTATAADGKFTTLTNLDNAESFTYGGATYTQNIPGLIDTTGNVICADILAGATINLPDLKNATWNNFTAPVDGVLDISGLDSNNIVYDSATTPTTKYATLTLEEGKKTLAGEDIAAENISEIVIAAGDNLSVDFVTQVDSPIGSVTVNGKTYAGTTELLIDSDGTTSTLYDGTITLDGTNTTATDSSGNTLTRANGSFTATAVEGAFTVVNDLDNTESFTYGGATYVQSAQGLRNGSRIRRDLTGTTINLSELGGGTWDNMLAPVNGVLDISNFSGNAYIYNSATNPTVQLATLATANGVKTLTNTNNAAGSISAVRIAAGDKLAVNFATQINAPIGSVTVNDKDYVGTTALVINSDGKTSTLTEGTITLADNGNKVATTGGTEITYTTESGDGLTIAVDNSGESEAVTFSELTMGDTFTIGEGAYKVSAVAPMNPAGELWTGGDYSEGITLAQINDAANWTPMLTAPDAALSINAETLADGGEVIIVDNLTDPTAIYSDLTKSGESYTLTRSTTANDNLTSINVSGVAIELAPDYAGVNFTANDSAFSDVTLNDAENSFTLDATNKPSLSDNVNALTLTAGTIEAAINQTVTTGDNVITPTAINGDMIIGTETISGIVEGDTFTLNDKAYTMLNTGLFNDTDNKLVTSGIDDGTLTISDIAETQLIAISNGNLNLTNAAAGNSLVVDTVESPANIYGALNKNENSYTLDKRSDGITSITLPAETSTLTTDIAATINAPSSSNTYTVNGKIYKANNSALVINSDGTTSTLTDGTINLTDNKDTVTTTSGSTVTYTTAGDGMTLAVTSDGITFSGLTAGDTFTIGDNAYRVSELGFHNDANYLWTSSTDYKDGVTLAQINDAANWTPVLIAENDSLSVNGETLTDGGEVIIVDNLTDPTAIYSDLTKSGESYTLTRSTTANDNLTSINVSGVAIELAPDYAGVNFTANDSAFSDVTLNDAENSFTLDATNKPSLSDNVNALTLTAGTIEAAINQTVTTGDNVITPTAINGDMIIGTETISGIVEGDTFTLNDKAYTMLNTGLFNDTDNKLVTSGIDDGTLTISDIAETQLIAISNGNLNLTNAAAGNSLVVDTVESPANIYGALNKNENSYTLDKRSDGITSITLPAETSTLTTDIAATINAPSSSNTYTVNGKIYKANNSALVINSDGTTSTLTDGTINLTDNKDTVTTTSGSTVTYTTAGDGMTLAVTSDGITFSGLTAGDTFTIGDNAYRVSELGFHNDANYLWTSSTDYKDGVTLAQINDAANWTPVLIAENDSLSVNGETLTDGATAIIIDSATAATKSLGTLSRTGDTYTLTKDANNKLSAIAVSDTKLAIDNQLADVPVTAGGATFTVKANAPYTVDATGNIVSISDDATAIEISAGTIAATTNQTVTATSDSGATSVIGQNNGTFNIGGETFAVADNIGSITFGMTNGVPDSVSNLEENANVTIDGRIYTAPQNNSTLIFSDSDGWYFEGYVPTKYNITIDENGNVIVDAGVKFSDVISSGQTLPENGTIKLAVDVNTIPINVTNASTTAININDINDNPLVANLGTVENVTFDSAGVMVENTSDVAGAVFTIDTGQSLETETATITANADDCAVGVGTNGTSLSIDKAATVDAPADTALTLGNARYTVNGVYFTTGGTAQASLTSDGVKFDLVASDVITYNRTKFDGTGTATAEIDKDRGISLTSGASIDGATGKTFNIAGTVTLDANTIDAASATDVKAKASGYAVGNDDVTITGDEDGYKLNISDGQISGLEYIGGESGVTIGGLSNGTIKTDKLGSMTVADKTFIAIGDASVTYGIENGTLTSASDVDSVITGDFSNGLTVNNGKLQVTGDTVSLNVSRNSNRKVDGFNDKATLTTADNVVKIEPTGAGEFTFGDHVFKVDDATIAFNLKNSSVTGVDSLENGNLIISQDEYNFIVNEESIDLAEINSPVTLEIADSGIHSVYGLHSGMDGLDVATVFGVSAATINNKYFEIAGGTLDAIVVDSIPASLYGLESDMTINSAPSVAIRTTENGKFTFRDDVFNINDTVDGVVVFKTDENTHVINIGEFAGEIYGDLENTGLNDKPFSTSSDKVTVTSDGDDILSLQGLSSGDSIGGSLSNATYTMPEGTLTVNDRGYLLEGDDNGVSMTGDGQVVVGLDKDASLTVAKGGAYSINNQNFKAKDGDTFIAGRDGVYIADPNNKAITEKTKIEDIIENLLGKPEKGTVSLSGDKAASVIASGNLDSPMALTLDSGVNKADFSDSSHSKRVTLLSGNHDVKFNDEGGNAAYVDKTATGRKKIELGDGDDVAVNDSPYARVSIKAGKGADTIVNRNGAKSTVDVKNNGDTTIVPTSGRVTLQNYDNDNNAKIRTFEYRDLVGAIMSNEVKFGDGRMTLGDAVVVFDPDAEKFGGTFANLVDYAGEEQRVGFTHSNGGVLNASTSADDLILKGNYAANSSDKTKNGASTLISGRGNDTILAGGDDYVDAGAGDNQIYITDKSLAGGDGVTIVLGDKGKNTVHNFNSGFDNGDAVKVNDVSKVNFIFGDDGLVMRSGKSLITFDGLEPADELVTYNDPDTSAPYEIKLSDGKKDYNAAIAQEGRDIGVREDSEANLFYGDKNSKTGLNFSEYAGAIEVNLNTGLGSVNGSAAQFYNISKVTAGEGDASLIGRSGANNTLTAGTGNTSMWSAAGRDLMVGNTSEEKSGSTTFYYLPGDGRDTITNFGFMTSANDYNADLIDITQENDVGEVYLRDGNVIIQLNNSSDDYLTVTDAQGKYMKFNKVIAKVDVNANFDELANCYVATSDNATMSLGAGIEKAEIWLDDRRTGQHGIYYLGEFKYLDAKAATGNSTLVGNDLDNVIYGGTGKNSIWGGFGYNDDTLVGGSGQNTFFFGMQNGNDTITSIKDGDIIDLTTIGLEHITATTVNSGGAKIQLSDGSSLEIKGTAAAEYRLNDGSTYIADHNSGQFIKR